MQTKQKDEKRQHLRLPSSRPIVLMINQQHIYATMTDFSRHGLGMMARVSAPLHSRVEVHFDMPLAPGSDELRPFQFKAEVKHCIDCHHENHIGVQLELPSQDYLHLFDQLSTA